MTAHTELEKIATMAAEKAATAAVENLFRAIGVDTSDPFEMQRDFAYLRAWREGTALVRRTSVKTAIAFVVTGTLGLLYAFFTHRP